MSSIWRDLRHGGRTLVRAPGYTAVTTLTLALAIGANTLLFSIANPLVIRGLPIADVDRVGWILLSSAERDIERGRSSIPEFLEWRGAMTSFTETAALEYSGGTMTGHGDARRLQTGRATATLPAVWGLRPVLGRLFQPGEDAPGRPMVGVLSHRFWREAFDADPAAIGRTFALDGVPFTIVGVMQPSIELGNLALIDLWVPLPLDSSAPRDRRTLIVSGKLADGATIDSADAELQTIFANQTRAFPKETTGWRANVRPARDAISSSDTWIVLGLLAVVVAFVLLIACANLANLVMARLVAGRRESAVRLALGASRWQLVRPLLAESALLGLAGGALGLGLAYGGLRIINAIASEPFMRQIGIDSNVLIFTTLLSLVTPLLFSVLPALSAGRRVDASTLHGARTSDVRSASRKRKALIGAQVALALSLLVLSALVTQSMMFLRRIDPGFEPRPLLTYRLDLPEARYATEASRRIFAADLKARLDALPQVEGAALMSHMPVVEGDSARALSGTLRDGGTEQDRPWASWFVVTPDFFRVTGIGVLAGRPIDGSDRESTAAVAVINRMAADRFFDGVTNAVGRSVVIHDSASGERRVTIAGVVEDTRDAQLTRSSPQIYVPFAQWPRPSVRVVVRAVDPLARAQDVQAVMRAIDPEVAVADLKPMYQIFEEEMSSSKILNGLFVSYALLALTLAAGGLFGVISYSVSQRRREIGVRLALGASPRAIARMILREGLVVTGVGAAVGMILAVVLAQLSSSLLFGVSARDPMTFGGVAVLIVLVALAASAAPAGRAMRIDPARTLRAD